MSLELTLITIGIIHRLLESLPIQKWKQVDAHPSISGAVDIKFHICWIEVDDLTGWLVELVVALWESVATLLGENGKELLEGLCWLSLFEGDVKSVTP